MKCPIRSIQIKWLGENELREPLDCLKDKCEWWSEVSLQCRVCCISGELFSLVEVMEEIRDKLAGWAYTQGVKE